MVPYESDLQELSVMRNFANEFSLGTIASVLTFANLCTMAAFTRV